MNRPDEEGECPFAEIRQPPLGIKHLMLWMTSIGVILGANQWLDQVTGTFDESRTFSALYNALSSIVYGPALAAVPLFIARRLKRGAPFPAEPGHWILLNEGIGFAIAFPLCAAPRAIEAAAIPAYNVGYGVSDALASAVETLLYANAALRSRCGMYWRGYFGACAVWSVGGILEGLMYIPKSMRDGAYSYMHLIRGCSLLMVAMWLAFAVLVDGSRRNRSDWLHFVGVAVSFGSTLHWFAGPWVLWVASLIEPIMSGLGSRI